MNLSNREKKLGWLLGAVAIAWTAYMAIIGPSQERIATLKRVIPQKQAALRQVRDQARTCQQVQRQLAGIRQQAAEARRYPPRRRVEQVLEQLELSSQTRISAAPAGEHGRYRETAVQIKLAGISHRQMAELINRLSRESGLRITNAMVRAGQDATGKPNGPTGLTGLTGQIEVRAIELNTP